MTQLVDSCDVAHAHKSPYIPMYMHVHLHVYVGLSVELCVKKVENCT